MSEEPGFLSRWSRRKRAAQGTPAVAPPAEPATDGAAAATPDLPPIESLGSASDYAVFLQKGVSALVQQQALQKAWTSDAGIAGFRGMAEYDWDFNAVGYGRLRLTDDVGRLLRSVLAQPEPEAAPDLEPEPAAAAPAVAVRQSPAPVPDSPAPEPPEPLRPADVAASETPAPQRHGSAKPV